LVDNLNVEFLLGACLAGFTQSALLQRGEIFPGPIHNDTNSIIIVHGAKVSAIAAAIA
jgi:hypothetical protein